MKTFQKICLPLACLSVLSFGAGSLSPQSAAVLSVCDAKAAGQAAARRVSYNGPAVKTTLKNFGSIIFPVG